MIARAPAKRSRSAAPSRERVTGATAAPVTLPGESATPRFTARLVPLDPGFYAFSLAAETGWRETVAGLALPAIQVCAAPDQGSAIEITDSFGRTGSWLGGRHNMLFVTAPAGGGAALVTAYLARDPDSMPLEVEIRRVGAPGPATVLSDAESAGVGHAGSATVHSAPPFVRLTMGGAAAADRSRQRVSLEVVAHIRGRGDVRFVDTPWIGRMGPGLWIEAFGIFARDPAAAAAIEYKGLSTSGAETPWLGGGSPCGTRGRGIALIGFAVRQKAVAGGALFDCEYTGYFQSGATSRPTRNGAPCRSAVDNDPLEGMQLRISRRPARPAPAETE
jgi:hypothetical protein